MEREAIGRPARLGRCVCALASACPANFRSYFHDIQNILRTKPQPAVFLSPIYRLAHGPVHHFCLFFLISLTISTPHGSILSIGYPPRALSSQVLPSGELGAPFALPSHSLHQMAGSRARAVARSRRLLQCVGARVVALRLATATTIRGGRGMTVFLFTAMVLQVVVGRLLLQLPTLDCPNSPQM